MATQVYNLEELKKAVESGEDEIVSYDEDVVKKLKAIKTAKRWGPVAVAALVAGIPFVVATGGLGLGVVTIAAPGAAVTTSVIVALVIAIGGTIVIALLTDWEYVEIGPKGIKMKRKNKE